MNTHVTSRTALELSLETKAQFALLFTDQLKTLDGIFSDPKHQIATFGPGPFDIHVTGIDTTGHYELAIEYVPLNLESVTNAGDLFVYRLSDMRDNPGFNTPDFRLGAHHWRFNTVATTMRLGDNGLPEFDALGFIDWLVPDDKVSHPGWMERIGALHTIGGKLDELIKQFS